MPELHEVVEVLIRNAGWPRASWSPEDSNLVEEWLEAEKPSAPKSTPKATGGRTV